MNSSDKQLEQRLRTLYQEASYRIDPATAGRLRAARRTALQAAATSGSVHHRARVLLPVGALAAIALAALVIWQPAPHPQDSTQSQTTVGVEQDEYLPPGADKADPGLYQNLEFYSWLASSDGSQSKR